MDIGEAWLGPVHRTLVHSQSMSPGYPFCHFLGFPLLCRFLVQKLSLPPPFDNPALGEGSGNFHLYPTVPDGEKHKMNCPLGL